MNDYLSSVLPYPRDTVVINVKDFAHGHISLRTAFAMGGNPKDNAEKIKNELQQNDNVKKVEVLGPYVNIWMNDSFYMGFLNMSDETTRKAGQISETVMVEYPSANPNKPLHLGHLRNMILGDTASNLYEHLGYNVVRVNYINDMGLQVAQLLWDYLKNQPSEDDKKRIDYYLGERYVEISKSVDDPKVKAEVGEILKKLEEGSNNVSQAGREMTELCVLRHHQTMFRFNVYHDYDVFESDVVHNLFEEGMDKIKSNADVYMVEDGELKGCYVIKLKDEEFKNLLNTEKVLIRSNGTLTYAGKDVIFHLWKLGALDNDIPITKWHIQPNDKFLMYSKDDGSFTCPKCDRVINVIGREQDLEQKVVRYALSKVLGDDTIKKRYYHMSYGLVRLSGSKFSGRKGTWKGYAVDDVLDEGIERTKDVLKRYNYRGDDATAKAMAVSAVRFAMLKYSPQKDFDFDWDNALTFEGDSAPYIQYAYVRCLGILNNVKNKEVSNLPGDYHFNDDEILILNNLMRFEKVLNDSAEDLKLNNIISYMLNIVPVFNRFYDSCRIIDEGQVNPVRLRIVEKMVNVLGTAMDICGIIKLEKM